METNELIKENKEALRKEIKVKKSAFNKENYPIESDNVFAQIEQSPAFKEAKTVLAYWSLPKEVETHRFVDKWYKHKTIILPLVVGDILELRVYSGPDCMVVGPSFGILEPQKGEIFTEQSIDFGIIPGMAFDLKGNRIGRGKGYYDKLLKTISVPKFGVCLSFQLVDSVPVDHYDITMDRVIYPKNL
ncbi:MAG: 5-formyltetrahydrofolate cyclo-ligase [Bacteroidales bacterium]|jgi:5-formyltetrahydrofolate cyclo-ligase|nr:5-formyltetrahydrofolate cyclo-ligase [Bacteroidales bacterium]MDD4384949.1 5-formyltetrahydrofolate cyclo-ligase [Bacteroidales bacterium]MDY0197024.1 5-formyltetrahydrofolate cyclo-ligase [Tenuifilaceae bacterium]